MCSELHFKLFQAVAIPSLSAALSDGCADSFRWLAGCTSLRAGFLSGERLGCHVRIEFGTTDVVETPVSPAETAKKKHGWLPVLVVLFLISYALMTMLIVEQGRTIESQRVLIHDLFRDSQELSAVRQKALEEKSQSAQAQSAVEDPSSQNAMTPLAQAPSNYASSNQAPSSRIPSSAAPSRVAPSTPSTQAKPAPSAQAKAQGRTQNEAAKQKQFKMPSRPASDLVDADRSLNLI